MNFLANPIFADFTELCIHSMKWWWISLFRCESICELDSVTCNLSPIWPFRPLFRSCGLSIRGTFGQVCQAGKLTTSSKLSLLPTPPTSSPTHPQESVLPTWWASQALLRAKQEAGSGRSQPCQVQGSPQEPPPQVAMPLWC